MARSATSYIYVLHGDDELARREFVHALKEKMRALPAGEHNIIEMEGDEISLGDLRATCGVVPFLADRRMVIVRGLVARAVGPGAWRKRAGSSGDVTGDRSEADELFAYLADLPPWTHLVLVESSVDEDLVRSKVPPQRLVLRRFDRPDRSSLPAWIQRRVASGGARIEPSAAALLAAMIPDDPLLLEQEIAKLSTYCAGRAIRSEDVRLLVTSAEPHVFALLDAVAEGRAGDALDTVRRLLDQGEKPESALAQLASMLRRLLQVLELGGNGRVDPVAAQEHGLNPRALARLVGQARRWSAQRVESAMALLLEYDNRIKTGALDPATALELAILEMAIGRPSAIAQHVARRR